ncbi:glycerophosphocholine cholinephosphodiesterase ENPP6-like [Ruditapes philippinarum]|uniref:glycerophosphocholine cholinephosphodiesterase ENPP6-like n=1 Tax=Ruditapes philippinarum TaxID=129788 RepID=UPI00295AFAD9|nr:glycerophosphocholine cholinephosphodiesterase ENPP6-like [Ruditapes philippinarum]
MLCRVTFLFSFIIGLDYKLTFVNASKLIILLVDGFRWDYIESYHDLQLRGFSRLVDKGARAEWMVPAFPTNSLPNYKSLETVCMSKVIGVVGNFIYDSKHGDKLEYMLSDDAKWWTEKPSFFVTAEKQGIRTGLYNMGGCYLEFDGVNVSYCSPYQDSSSFKDSQNAVLDAVRRIHSGKIDIAYILHADVDAIGHSFGPGSPQLKQAVKDTDELISSVFQYLDTNHVTDVNIMVLYRPWEWPALMIQTLLTSSPTWFRYE